MNRDTTIFLTAIACVCATIFLLVVAITTTQEVKALRELLDTKQEIIDEQWSVIRGYQKYMERHREVCNAIND